MAALVSIDDRPWPSLAPIRTSTKSLSNHKHEYVIDQSFDHQTQLANQHDQTSFRDDDDDLHQWVSSSSPAAAVAAAPLLRRQFSNHMLYHSSPLTNQAEQLISMHEDIYDESAPRSSHHADSIGLDSTPACDDGAHSFKSAKTDHNSIRKISRIHLFFCQCFSIRRWRRRLCRGPPSSTTSFSTSTTSSSSASAPTTSSTTSSCMSRRSRRIIRSMIRYPNLMQQKSMNSPTWPLSSRSTATLPSPGRIQPLSPAASRHLLASPGRSPAHHFSGSLPSPSMSPSRPRKPRPKFTMIPDSAVGKKLKPPDFDQEPSSPEVSCIGRIKKEAQCKNSVVADNPYLIKKSEIKKLHPSSKARTSSMAHHTKPVQISASQRFGRTKLHNLHKISAVDHVGELEAAQNNRSTDVKLSPQPQAADSVYDKLKLKNSDHKKDTDCNVIILGSDHKSSTIHLKVDVVDCRDFKDPGAEPDGEDTSSEKLSIYGSADSRKESQETQSEVVLSPIRVSASGPDSANPPANCLSLMRSTGSSRRRPSEFDLV